MVRGRCGGYLMKNTHITSPRRGSMTHRMYHHLIGSIWRAWRLGVLAGGVDRGIC